MVHLPTKRLRALRLPRRGDDRRQIRRVTLDAHAPETRAGVARSVASLDRADEQDALDWIEAVSEFDNAR